MRFVRITDLGNSAGAKGTAGFDLDAVVAVHFAGAEVNWAGMAFWETNLVGKKRTNPGTIEPSGKAQAIRDFLAANPDATPKEVVAALKKFGIVSEEYGRRFKYEKRNRGMREDAASTWTDATEQRVDESCMERLGSAVESLLICSDLSKGLEGAFLQLAPLQEWDFPTDELAEQFERIMEKHLSLMENYVVRHDLHVHEKAPPRSRYSSVAGPTKHWFKKHIWKLFRACVRHNEMR